MNTPNRHMRYRRSVYRKRKIKTVVITTICVLVLIFLAFVIVGNVLNHRDDTQDEQVPTGDPSVQEAPQSSNRKIANAYPVALSEEGSSLASRLNSAKSLGYTDICFYLDGADGSLLYNSDVAIALGKHTQNSDLRSLSSISNLFDTNGLYSIAITCMSDFSSENELIRTAAIGYNSARIAEALRGGIDEVMIYVGDIPAERYYELIRVADEVKRLSTDGKIGIVLTPDLIENSSDMEVKELIYQLSLKFDHLAVDLSVVYGDAEVTNMGEYIDSELGKMLLYVLQYNMRVLVPNTDDAALSSAIRSALESRSINNVQIMP